MSAAQPTEAIVAFAGGAWAMRAPEREAGRALVAGVLADAIAGAHDADVEIAIAGLVSRDARPSAGLIGRPERAGAPEAAFVNGISVGVMPASAAPVVCAALAAGESVHAPGAVVLDAVIAGCEIALRLAAALGPAHLERGWVPDGTAGRIGAAVAAARVYGLNAEKTRHAIGIAATAAGGLGAAADTMTAAYVRGAAAADGVEAALLARFGFTGAPAAIEGRRGLAALMTAAFDATAVTAGLGEEYVLHAVAGAAPILPDAIASLVARLERLPAIDELLIATRS